MEPSKPGPKNTTSVFGFLDESGLLHTPKEDRVFALGLIKLRQPSLIHRQIIRLKQQNNFKGEFKFTNLEYKNLNFYKDFTDIFFSTPNSYFSAIVFDKINLDIKKFHKDQFSAYNAFSAKLIAESLDAGEYICVIADDVTTPKGDHFEKEMRKKIQKRLRRNALFGVTRAESHGFSELQLSDVLLGAVAYAFKIKYKLVKPSKRSPELKLIKHIQKRLNIPLLAEKMNRKMRFGCVFKINEFEGKKIDSALGKIGN